MTIDEHKRKPRISRAEARLIHPSILEQRALDRRLDDALCETFPASDPVAISVPAPKPLLHR